MSASGDKADIANEVNGKCPQDLERDAMAAWRRFVSCVELLPPDQAAPLWEIALAEFPQLSGGVGELPRPVGPKVLASLLLLTGLNQLGFYALQLLSELLGLCVPGLLHLLSNPVNEFLRALILRGLLDLRNHI